MQIPFHRPYITESEINAMAESVRSGWITMGRKTQEFEEEFKKYLGVNEAVAVNSCTAALHLALKCVGIKDNDEVIIPAITHASTAEAVGYLNAKPVIVDTDRDTHLIDITEIEKKITKKTKAIIPVHYAGQPAEMKKIQELAKKYNLYVIEDAAHAFPSKYYNKLVGTIGDITCFSFYATKTITTGEGGMATTDNTEWANRMRLLRLHGVTRDAWIRENANNFWEYDVIEPGFKYNPMDISSAMGIEQLKKTDEMQRMREKIAQKYNEAFINNNSLIQYVIREYSETSWYLYPIKLNLESLRINRDRFINELKIKSVSASVHFIPLYRLTYYKNLGYNKDDFPNSEWIFERSFSLPIYPGMTDLEIDYVIENVLYIAKKYKK